MVSVPSCSEPLKQQVTQKRPALRKTDNTLSLDKGDIRSLCAEKTFWKCYGKQYYDLINVCFMPDSFTKIKHVSSACCHQMFLNHRLFPSLMQQISLDFQFKPVPGSQPSVPPAPFSHFKNMGGNGNSCYYWKPPLTDNQNQGGISTPCKADGVTLSSQGALLCHA